MYSLLYYNDLDYDGLKTKFDKVVQLLKEGDFKSAEVKKLKPTSYFRAKLDDSNRLLFTMIKHESQLFLLILEVIKNHAYNKSRFLRGAQIIEENIVSPVPEDDSSQILKYIATNHPVHLLDKFIVFDPEQTEILHYPLPLILIGSAGSGKTSVMLEKIKSITGRILYISLSSYLVNNAKKLYFAHQYYNEDQDIDFLSFKELIETICIPGKQEITRSVFQQWFMRTPKTKNIGDAYQLFEEFAGVIAGNSSKLYLSKEDYLSLGIKQTIYLAQQRQEVYALFEEYLRFLQAENYYDPNILAYDYQGLITPQYDAVIIDEVQDFTSSQLSLAMKGLNNKHKFLLSGDANQIVHPNFFSWSSLKSYFYQDESLSTHSITRLLTKNYRNTPEVIELANRVLKLKNYRFGSIDQESHYLIESTSKIHGTVSCLEHRPEVIKAINDSTAKSIHYAILVLYEHQKKQARELFASPLIFTVQEAKGLEYDNIILFNFISPEAKYQEISSGIDDTFLKVDFKYSRAKDKSDKSLEIYKFYLNALYVAVTRALQNVYLIEANPQHQFLKLLHIHKINAVNIKAEQSSREEWQKEAGKLALQGKQEQVEAIEANILKSTNIPWIPITLDELNKLQVKVFEEKTANKKDVIRLLNYAIVYNDYLLINKLQEHGVKAANNINKCDLLLQEEYMQDYVYKNTEIMLKSINNYGVEFRNIFNLTPLMCAAYLGSKAHVEKLTALGASVEAVDNNNRNAFMIALSKGLANEKYCQHKLANIYDELKADSLSLKINNKLVKITPEKPEYFFLLMMISRAKNSNQYNLNNSYIQNKNINHFSFSAVSLHQQISNFPEKILPNYRKKREYISSVISRNEINSKYQANKQLFIRINRGIYIINDQIMLKVKDKWVEIYGGYLSR